MRRKRIMTQDISLHSMTSNDITLHHGTDQAASRHGDAGSKHCKVPVQRHLTQNIHTGTEQSDPPSFVAEERGAAQEGHEDAVGSQGCSVRAIMCAHIIGEDAVCM